MVDEFKISKAEVARRLGMSPSWVSNILTFRSAEGVARTAVDEGLITEPEALRQFTKLPEGLQVELLHRAKEAGDKISRSVVARTLQLVPDPPDEDVPVPDRGGESTSGTIEQLPASQAPRKTTPAPPARKKAGRPSGPRTYPLPQLQLVEYQKLCTLLGILVPKDASEIPDAAKHLRTLLSSTE